jgi:hypothetical protein
VSRPAQLDSHETVRLDKAVVTSMPQLSSAALAAAAVSLPAARLYALLADGAVHVWQMHLRRPPSFVVRGGGWGGERPPPQQQQQQAQQPRRGVKGHHGALQRCSAGPAPRQ